MPKTYYNSEKKRRLGRVGMPLGSMPNPKAAGAIYSWSAYTESCSSSNPAYAGGSRPHPSSIGRPNRPHPTSSPCAKVSNTYTGYTATASHYASISDDRPTKTYVDTDVNKKLGRVGKPIGSCPVPSTSKADKHMTDIIKHVAKGDVGRKKKSQKDVGSDDSSDDDDDFDNATCVTTMTVNFRSVIKQERNHNLR